jgi:fructokinase
VTKPPAKAGQAAHEGTILVCGEALYDLVLDDAGELRGAPGGGPFNTARTIARLGQPVTFLTRVSSDSFGTKLVEMLADDGVQLDAVVRTSDPTTLALADVDETGAARYAFFIDGTAAAGLSAEAALSVIPPAVSMVHAGTLALALEPIATAVEALVDHLSATALVALDPNVRPSAISEPAAYRRRLGRLLRASHLVKVSDDDLAWIDPRRSATDAARALLELGPDVVLLTRGREGALVLTHTREEPISSPAVAVQDTIGAGDAFGGGFLAWWRIRKLGRADLADADLVVEAARFAALVASRTCERAGASPPLLDELG